MLGIHLLSIFTIKTPQALPVLALLGLLIVKTLTNVLKLLHKHIVVIIQILFVCLNCLMSLRNVGAVVSTSYS